MTAWSSGGSASVSASDSAFSLGRLDSCGCAQLDQQVDERARTAARRARTAPRRPRAGSRGPGRTPCRCSPSASASRSRVSAVPVASTSDRSAPTRCAGDEEPVPGDAPAGHRLQAATERAVRGRPVLVDPAELQPGVAEPFGVRVLAAEQQVPLHALLRVGVRLDPVRRQVAVQQERQHQREHLGLAGAVVAAQQQAAVAEPELLLVVVEEVDQTGAQRLPALAGGQRAARRSRAFAVMVGSASA